jgi:hypothetical protein
MIFYVLMIFSCWKLLSSESFAAFAHLWTNLTPTRHPPSHSDMILMGHFNLTAMSVCA